MKLERLRLYQQELLQEFDGEPINPAIYYFYREGWHLLDGEGKVSLRIVKALNESTRTTQAYFAGRECWFHLELLQATVRINLSGAKGIRQRTKPALLEKLQKVSRHATNSYLVSHNPLTQLLSRDAFKDKLNNSMRALPATSYWDGDEASIAISREKSLTLLALDIDNFKQINDTYGHLYGDQVLKIFARRLEATASSIVQKNIDTEIVLGHPSGEEFLVSILSDEDPVQVVEWANEFRIAIGGTVLPTDDEWDLLGKHENLADISFPPAPERRVTTSIGLKVADVEKEGELSSKKIVNLLDDADTALYRAKAAGRNRVISYEDILANCGRVIEHDQSTGVVAIDIGKNVGVSMGQEFKVFAPKYSGNSQFTVNDGRTTRSLGIYPRVHQTTIAVFDVQPDLSFAYINSKLPSDAKIEFSSGLEAIPYGSIGHLLLDPDSKFLPTSAVSKVGDTLAAQALVIAAADSADKPYAAVFRFSNEEEYVRNYGGAAFNKSLAVLYAELDRYFVSTHIKCQLDIASICVVGRVSQFNVDMGQISRQLQSQLKRLTLRIGLFSPKSSTEKNDLSAVSVNAIQLAQYAASDYALTDLDRNTGYVEFRTDIAVTILNSSWQAKKYKECLANFEKFISYGISNQSLLNIGGLAYVAVGNPRRGLEIFEQACVLPDVRATIILNGGATACDMGEWERGLALVSKLTDKMFLTVSQNKSYGIACYAFLLAQAKSLGLAGFNLARFKTISSAAVVTFESRHPERSRIINEVLASVDAPGDGGVDRDG